MVAGVYSARRSVLLDHSQLRLTPMTPRCLSLYFTLALGCYQSVPVVPPSDGGPPDAGPLLACPDRPAEGEILLQSEDCTPFVLDSQISGRWFSGFGHGVGVHITTEAGVPYSISVYEGEPRIARHTIEPYDVCLPNSEERYNISPHGAAAVLGVPRDAGRLVSNLASALIPYPTSGWALDDEPIVARVDADSEVEQLLVRVGPHSRIDLLSGGPFRMYRRRFRRDGRTLVNSLPTLTLDREGWPIGFKTVDVGSRDDEVVFEDLVAPVRPERREFEVDVSAATAWNLEVVGVEPAACRADLAEVVMMGRRDVMRCPESGVGRVEEVDGTTIRGSVAFIPFTDPPTTHIFVVLRSADEQVEALVSAPLPEPGETARMVVPEVEEIAARFVSQTDYEVRVRGASGHHGFLSAVLRGRNALTVIDYRDRGLLEACASEVMILYGLDDEPVEDVWAGVIRRHGAPPWDATAVPASVLRKRVPILPRD